MTTTAPSTAPLTGTRVVTIAVNLPGPMTAARLTAFGASVVKVEPPTGDPMAHYALAWYEEMARGQTVEVADLKSPDGLARLGALLADADILVTSHRGSALTRLGLDWATLHAAYPRLIHVAIVGHGGPDTDVPGHDLTYQAAAGILTPPAMPRALVADLAGAERAVQEALAGLLLRTHTGAGSYREVALADMAGAFGAPARHGLTTAGALLGGALPTYRMYASADGWVALAALEPHFADRLAAVIGATPTPEGLTAMFAAEPGAHWHTWAQRHDIPLEVVA